MSIRVKPVFFVACGLAALPIAARQYSARAATYPYQKAQSFHVDGTVTLVDADRDRVTIRASDGREYMLDTDDTQIKLRDTSRPGDTGDLVTGMHVDVTGCLLFSFFVVVVCVFVLLFSGLVVAVLV